VIVPHDGKGINSVPTVNTFPTIAILPTSWF